MLTTPSVEQLGELIDALRDWQRDDAPLQLHPGDLGWAWQHGTDAMAAALRVWRADGRVVAIGMLDTSTVLRLTTAPDRADDEGLTDQLVADIVDPGRGVLPAGAVAVEAPNGYRVQHALVEAGWEIGEPWTPLGRRLDEPVPTPDLRVEVIDARQAPDYVAVHRSSFRSERFTPELWQTMTDGLPFTDARSLLGYDEHGTPVAEVTVWSAGPGRPGLLEPMGVHADHHGRGYGRAICVAAAAALQEMGASMALVCTPSANVGGVATYVSAGYEKWPERRDRARPT